MRNEFSVVNFPNNGRKESRKLPTASPFFQTLCRIASRYPPPMWNYCKPRESLCSVWAGTKNLLSRAERTISMAGLRPHKVAFLGTPEPAARVLRKLIDESKHPGASYEVAAVVTQQPKLAGRGMKRLVPSAVEGVARDAGLEEGNQLLRPESAASADFLDRVAAIEPTMCVTAAYGLVLPAQFLDIPLQGTVNVHPSLLPKYRGAAPVARAIEAGEERTGVSLAYTVEELDAGPVIAREERNIGDDDDTPGLTFELFDAGATLLSRWMHPLLSGEAKEQAEEQDASVATRAPRLKKSESWLDFRAQTARQLHNRVRAFAGWPGAQARLLIGTNPVDVKVHKTRVAPDPPSSSDQVAIVDGAVRVPCRDNSALDILQLQEPGKKVKAAESFANGLQGKPVSLPAATN